MSESGIVEQHQEIPRLKAQEIEAFYRSKNEKASTPIYKIRTSPIDLLYCALEVLWFSATPEAEFRVKS